MKKAKKVLALFLAAVMLVCTTVAATVAYLYSKTEVVQNTFAVGDIKITLDEALVDEKGKEVTGEDAARVPTNEYHVFPGMTYDKDPTVHVEVEDAERAYVRMQVKVSDLAKLKQAFTVEKYPTWYAENGEVFLLQMLTPDWNKTAWETKGFDPATGIYEFWYYKVVDVDDYTDTDGDGYIDLEPLFETVSIPASVNNTELQFLDNLKLDVVAHAIQAEGFETAEEAWAAFAAEGYNA